VHSGRKIAEYFNTVHAKLHPVFADTFLPSRTSEPSDGESLRVQVNLQIEQREGILQRMTIAKTSGVAEFDAAAMEAFLLVFPIPAPVEITAANGLVYVTWYMRNDPRQACSAITSGLYQRRPSKK